MECICFSVGVNWKEIICGYYMTINFVRLCTVFVYLITYAMWCIISDYFVCQEFHCVCLCCVVYVGC